MGKGARNRKIRAIAGGYPRGARRLKRFRRELTRGRQAPSKVKGPIVFQPERKER